MSYSYDAAGQRTSHSGGFATNPGPTVSAGTNTFDLNNRQTVWNGFALSYDVNGDPTSNASTSPATSYTFDARHRLTQIQQGANTVATFSYDSFGRRTSKIINGVTTRFLYDGQNAVQETQGTTVTAILTGGAIDERLARDDEAYGRTYFLLDALGSTVALADASQAVRQTYGYEPYGEVTSTGASDNPYQYTGRENDGTGLYYYRARYYPPKMKRFVSEDPLELRAGLDEYAYVFGDPVSTRDSTGKMPWIVAGALIGGTLNAGGSLLFQLWTNGGNIHCVNWKNVGWSFVTGAAGGALMTTGLGTTALGVAGIGGVTNLVNYGLTNETYSWGGAAFAVTTGAAGNLVGGAFKNPYWLYKPSPFNPNPSMYPANMTPSGMGRAAAGALTSSYTNDPCDCH